MATWLRANWLLLTFLLAIASAFTLLRSKPSNVETTDELARLLTAGQPTVVEFYSNF
jgi:hypothetical protein